MKPTVPLLVLVAALADPAAAQQSTPAAPLAPEIFAARMLAEMEAGQKARLRDLRRLEEAVAAEPRHDGWASAEEDRLKQAFADRGAEAAGRGAEAAPGAGAGALAMLDCRQARCAIEVKLSQELPPEDHMAELQAIETWIATTQPCSYTLIPPVPGSGDPVRAFTECEG